MHEGLRLAPDNAEALLNLARSSHWMGKGNIELAIADFQRALELEPRTLATTTWNWRWPTR